MAVSLEELREQIIAVALDRAFLQSNLPADALQKARGRRRGRLTLIASEGGPPVRTILLEYATAARKIKKTPRTPDATADCAPVGSPVWCPALSCRPRPGSAAAPGARYSRPSPCAWTSTAPTPARDAARLAELTAGQRYWRLVAERKGPWTSAWRNSAGCWRNCA